MGLAAVRALAGVVPAGVTMAQFALRWIVDQPGVSAVIPGARNVGQVGGNVAAAEVAPLTAEQQAAVAEVYNTYVREHVHTRW